MDTPGLNDKRGDEKNIQKIKRALSDYPIKCILILDYQKVQLKYWNHL